MTKEEAFKKYLEILKETNEKSDIVMKQAMKEGRWLPGLDSNRHLFDEIDAEGKRKLRELVAQIDE